MKKLIIGFAVVLFSVLSVLADEWKSVIYDNVVNDICVTSDKIYTATNGGIEIFWKDTSKRFEDGMSWKIYTTVNSSLPKNFVHSIVADTFGNIWAMGDDWFSCFSGNMSTGKHSWNDIGGVQSAEDIAMGTDGVKWVIMTINSKRGLYREGGMGWEYIPMPAEIPLEDFSVGTSRIAIGGRGQGMDSAFNMIWLTCPTGITCYQGISGQSKVWQVGKELVAGTPLSISAHGDTVIASGETGVYIFTYGFASVATVIAYPPQADVTTGPPSMPRNNLGSVAYLNGNFYVGQKDGQLYSCTMTSGFNLTYGNGAGGDSRVGTNCLVTDGESLYWGTDWNLRVYTPGKPLEKRSVSIIHWPHNNDIVYIGKSDKNDSVLVSGSDFSAIYSKDGSLPNGNIFNAIVETSYLDKDGALWVGIDNGWISKIKNGETKAFFGDQIYREMMFSQKWLVGDKNGNVCLVTSVPPQVLEYDGESPCVNKLNAPEGLASEKILSVNSTGERLWIGTDSSVYSYDFNGNWTYKRLHYSPYRYVAGDMSASNGHVWVVDGGYADGSCDVRKYNVLEVSSEPIISSWPSDLKKRFPTSVCVSSNSEQSNFVVWVATDSGTYFLSGWPLSWQSVPLRDANGNHVLADDYVKTIYVDSATNSVWFGTAGGLTAWCRDQEAPVKPSVKPTLKIQRQGFAPKVFDLMGRKAISLNRCARGVNIIRLQDGRMIKNLNNLNINQQR